MSERIKILYINPGKPFYGAEKCLFGLLAHLNREKFSPILITPVGALYIKDFHELGVEVIELDTDICFNLRNFQKLLYANLKLIKIIRERKIDMVHLNMYCHADSLALFFIFLKFSKVPFIFHIQTPYIFAMHERFLMLSGHVICVSKAIYKQFLSKRRSDFITRPSLSKVSLIYYGRDLKKFSESNMSDSLRETFNLNGERVIGFIGAIYKRKRLDLFLRVAYETQKVDNNIKFLIVGDTYGNNETELVYKQNIFKLVNELNLDNNVIFTGFRNDIDKILKIIDVFVLTSKRDPLPGVIIEAMASGIPVVSSAVDGALDLVEDNKTGFLVSSDNPKDYAEKISFLLNNNACRKEMGRRGRERVVDLFDIKKNSLEIMSLYSSLLRN